MPPTDDLILPFQVEPFALRGRLVRLGTVVEDVVGTHGYPDAVGQMLAEAVALAALLAGALKYEGVFTLQTKGDGPIRLMVADVTSDGAVRGYAQFDPEALARANPGLSPVPRMLGAGYLAFTVDQGEHTERYQGIVELVGATLAECVHHYFRQSEQIETGILVAAASVPGAGLRAGGLMIQRLPPELRTLGDEAIETRLGFGGELAAEAEDEAWRRALMLMSTCSAAELTDPALSPEHLLFRLFHEDGVRVWPSHQLEARCRCSAERVTSILRSLPREELDDVTSDGRVEITCEFCGRQYSLDEAAFD